MKFVYYQKEGAKRVGILTPDETQIFPIGAAAPELESTTMINVIRHMDDDLLNKMKFALRLALDDRADFMPEVLIPVSDVKLLAPIRRPIHDIMCVGVNYQDHRDEDKEAADADYSEMEAAIYFGKRAVRIIGPEEAIEYRPDIDPNLDYEVELAVIIGKEGKDIKAEDAEDYIFGYSVLNDVSAREMQDKHNQWYRGKSLDTYTAMGPCIVTKDELPFPVEVDIICSVNGEERQHSNSRMLLRDIPNMIADLSQATTLEPGDIIATGTCGGVGMAMDPPGYMRPGDTVVCEVPEIGKLVNHIK